MREVRSYNRLLNEIINLNVDYKLEIIGCVGYGDKHYPMIALKHISKMANKTVLLLSGQHGNENYAVNVLLKWLAQPIMIPEFNYLIYPVINPFGYSHNSRDNGNRQDTNNDANFVKDSKVPELAILFDSFPHSGDLLIDVHGDVDKEECYIYEHKAEILPSIAEKALLENDTILPFIKNKTIYQIKVNNGVCEDREETGIEGFMEKLGMQYSITLEIPGKCNGQKRVAGGVAIINSILRNFKEVSK